MAIEMTNGDCLCGDTTLMVNAHDCTSITPFEDHAGPDMVYYIEITEDDQDVFVIGEADYDADWTIATVCDESTGDVLCTDWSGAHLDPTCGAIVHENFGFINYQFVGTGTYYIWVDGFNEDDFGEHCLEVFWQAQCLNHGDVNGSGHLTAEDAQMAFNILLGYYTPTYAEECAADCTGNGEVTADDSQMIFLTVLGMGGECADDL